MPGYKDLGPNVSQDPQDTGTGGQFSGEERAYESVVVQTDAPVIDWEMNLRGDVQSDYGLRLGTQRMLPSCFLDGDFMERPDVAGSYAFLAASVGNESKFQLRAQNAVINGWSVHVEYTETATAGLNDVQLTAPPVAGTRVDLVIMEVWRALIRAAPVASNKSATGLIVRNGNIKAPDAVNLTDDLIDPNYAAESNARVQIQYRLRVIENVNIATYPDGLTDPTVFANTVSDFGGPGADGTATAYNFAQVSADGGLWRAGTGDAVSAAAIGSVDGYMYAVPVCAVARRNSAAFDRDTNLNGGALIVAGTSDRPDGLFSDQVVAADVLDLRRGCTRDFQEVMDKMVQQLLDNTMSTQLEQSVPGPAGTSFIAKEDVGAGTSFGLSDGVRRHFSDRAVTESVVARVDLGVAVGSANFDLSALLLSWASGAVDLLTSGPAGTTIAGFGQIRVVQPSLSTDEDMLDPGSSIYVSASELRVNVGPQVDQLHLDFNTPTTVATTVYVELYVSYEPGHGTSRNMLGGDAFWVRGSLPAWVDATFLTATSDASRTSLNASLWEADPAHRELGVHFQSVAQVGVVFYTVATDRLLIWERLNGDPITITDGVNAPYATTNYTSNTAYTIVQLTGGVPITAGNAVSVDYVAFRAIPEVAVPPDDTYNLFYETAAVQSLLPPAGTQTLELIPRYVSKQVFVIGASTGSPDTPFPFASPGEQVPVAALPAPDYPESKVNGPADISVIGFGSNTGFLQLPAYVPYAPNPSQVTLYRNAPDAVTDAEGRNFWPKSDSGTPAVYSPVVLGAELASSRVHKVAVPVLAELKSDFASIGRKGTLVLVLLTNWITFDTANSVVLTPVAGTSGAGVFRVRGNMLNPRRVDP